MGNNVHSFDPVINSESKALIFGTLPGEISLSRNQYYANPQMMPRGNIILIGMPGSGKSTVGVLAAKALGMCFIDTDLLLQQRLGRLLHTAIQEEGIEAFLDREAEIISGLSVQGHMIATGGSVVLRQEAMSHLAASVHAVVYLKVPLAALQRRLGDITTRGIAMDAAQTIADVYALRAPLYERYATHILDCAGQRLEDTVAALVRLAREGTPGSAQTRLRGIAP